MKKINIRNVNKKQLFFIGVGICMLILIIVGISFYKNRKVTIDLNDYITVEYKGYDTVGTAMAYWDMDALQEDYGDKIRINKKELERYNESHIPISDSSPFQDMINQCVMGGLDKNADLTNNETIKFIWNCDTELAKKLFYCKLKCEDKEYTVEGLKEVEQIDPFENLMVTYEGTSPLGRVECKSKSTEGVYGDIFYSVAYPREDAEENVKNGDEVTITAKVKNMNEIIKEYGVTFSVTEKTYIVEGLPEYVISAESLTEEVLTQMQAEVADRVAEKIEQDIQKNDSQSSHISGSLVSVDYVGNYLMTEKDLLLSGGVDVNVCNMIYQVIVHEDLQLKSGETRSYEIPYYLAAQVKDIVIDPSGACSFGNSRVLWGGVYKYETDVKQGIFGLPVTFKFNGYESLEAYYDAEQADRWDEYDVTTTIQ